MLRIGTKVGGAVPASESKFVDRDPRFHPLHACSSPKLLRNIYRRLERVDSSRLPDDLRDGHGEVAGVRSDVDEDVAVSQDLREE
jgi:hypothetical protein